MAVVKIRLNQKRRLAQIKRDSFRCCRCNRHEPDNWRDELVVHHIIPYKRGGTNAVGNMITLCHACHNFWHRVEVRLGKLFDLTESRYVGLFTRYLKHTGAYASVEPYDYKWWFSTFKHLLQEGKL